MFFPCSTVDQDIIQVDLTEQVDIRSQDIVHKPLPGSWGAGKPEWHYQGLKQAQFSLEGSEVL
jgi:hypothetical protein